MPTRNTVVSKDGLTLNEQRFIQAYIETGNGAESVRRAGYRLGARNGSKTLQKANSVASTMAEEILTRPDIKQAINKAIVKQNITPESVLIRINNIADNSKQDRDRLRGLELLGKALKMFTDTQEQKDVNITLTLGTFNGKIIEGEIVEQPKLTGNTDSSE